MCNWCIQANKGCEHANLFGYCEWSGCTEIDLESQDKQDKQDKFALICGYPIDKVVEIVNEYKHHRLVPADYILDRAELCDKEWEEDENHYCRNVADGLRELLQSWEVENG